MKKIKLTLFFVLISLITAGSIFASGGNRNGTAGASQLLIPVGARGIAMGGATLTNATGLDALYWNPANLAVSDYTTNALFSHMNYIADIGVEYGAVSTTLEGLGTVAISIKALDIDPINVTTVQNPDGTGQTFTPQFMVLGVTYARMLSDRVSVGLTTNFITEELGLVKASGVSFDIGVAYRNLANVQGLSLAIAMKNIGPQMNYDGSGLYVQATAEEYNRPAQFYKLETAAFELPSTLEIGMGYQYAFNESNSLQFSGVFQNNNFWGDEYKLGAEYNFNNLLFVRGGYNITPDLETEQNIYGLSAGVGLNYNLGGINFMVDYAYRQVEYFDDNHVITVGVGF